MKELLRVTFLVLGALVLVNPASTQNSICSNWMATTVSCSGPNNCSQSVAVIRPIFGSSESCLDRE